MSNKFPLAELQTLLEQARQSDAEYKQFGAATHKYQLNPPAALADVEAFEQQLGCTLPEAYRSFLLQAGNGGAGPFYGLFSLEQMQGWLDWPVEPTETPYLQPDVKIDNLCYLQDNDYNWQRGCLPIGSQGDTYFTYLLLAGPHRGRVVYVEYELSWVFFPREPDFLVWYTRWLREVAAGYNIGWFGLRLDGDEAALRQHYTQADNAAEKLLALDSLKKFPALSPTSQDFIRQIAPDWQSKTETGCLTELLYQIDPEQYEQFLAARWQAGIYDKVIYELYHTPGDKQALANRWYERILAKLPDIEPKTYCIALPILRRGGELRLEQVAFLLDKAQGREKYDLLLTFGRLPDPAAHLDFWLPLLAEREDLDLLLYALLSVPRLNNAQLREALLQVQAAFPYAQEQIYHIDYQNPEQMALSKRRSQEQKVYRTACTVWRDVFHEAINPKVAWLPRPYRLEMRPHDIHDLGMDLPAPPDGIPLHPLIALAIRQEMGGRLPSTAWDWAKKIRQLKKLRIRLSDNTVLGWDDEQRRVTLRPPDEHFPPTPYYYDLHDWSAISQMSSLRDLAITTIAVDDFSFLQHCKELRTLSLYNTNFTDCRLLLALPKLKKVDLGLCRLTHTEVLDNMHLEYEL